MNFKTTFDNILAAEQNRKVRKHPSQDEFRLQCSCVTWFRLQYKQYAHNLFAVPNGGKRTKAEAGMLKAEGVLAGVADLILLKSNHHYGALLIEMKTKIGRQSDEQKAWQALIEKDGYKYVVIRSFEEFQKAIKEYLADCDGTL